jgi:hypothetical protein
MFYFKHFVFIFVLYFTCICKVFPQEVDTSATEWKFFVFKPSIGISMGVGQNIFNLKQDNGLFPKMTSIIDYKAGVFFTNPVFGEDFTLKIGVNYSEKLNRYEYEEFHSPSVDSHYYVEIPLELSMEVYSKIFLTGGMVWVYTLEKLSKENMSNGITSYDFINPYTCFTFGGTYNATSRLDISFSYSIGLRPFKRDYRFSEGGKLFVNGWQITLSTRLF